MICQKCVDISSRSVEVEVKEGGGGGISVSITAWCYIPGPEEIGGNG